MKQMNKETQAQKREHIQNSDFNFIKIVAFLIQSPDHETFKLKHTEIALHMEKLAIHESSSFILDSRTLCPKGRGSVSWRGRKL